MIAAHRRRRGEQVETRRARASSSSRSTASALPVLQRAMRDGSAPNLARWIAERRLPARRVGDGPLVADRRQPGRHPARLERGHPRVPLGREGERRRMMTCSAPADCAEIERRRATGIGLLADGGASRGNLLSGEADEAILTVSRIDAEKRANPGYRAFLANGFNVTRALVLFVWEVVLEWTAAVARDPPRRAAARPPRRHLPVPARRDVRVRPRPDRLRRAQRHDARPPGRLRDVLELRRGRPPLRARAGRHDGGAAQARPAVRPDRARAPLRRRAPTRSSFSPTTGRPRARPSSSATATGSTSSSSARSTRGAVTELAGGDEQAAMVGHAVGEATGPRRRRSAPKNDVSGSRRRRPRLGQPRPRLPDGGAAAADARGDRRAPPAS